jgi:Mn-dependent DtxR family transcriptional regulator
LTPTAAGKGIESAIKHLLTDEYKFLGGERVQEMLAKDIVQLFRRYTRDPWSLDVGQTLWFAVDKDEKPGPAKTLAKMRITPVVLSVTHDEDKVLRANGCSHKEVRRFKVARILKEAYSQNGVLSQSDVSELLGVSAGTIGKDIREYQDENAVILPYRGTIHDIGPSLTHKKVIISLFLQNVPTPDISRKTCHTEEACDRYIKAFKRVKTLYGRMSPLEISRTLEMSERLVNEYIALIEEKESLKEAVNDFS